jgi:DNA-binding XRE family transcriptional regulator/SOS-response transcriptional repressor LexA
MRLRNRTEVPLWSRKIKDFRRSLKLSQSELAKRLGASPMAVSRWERGILKVPANIYIQLGNLAGDPLCWYFWGLTGLRTQDVMRVLPAAGKRLHESRAAKVVVVHAGAGKVPPSRETDFVAIPLLPSQAGTLRGEGNQVVDLEQVRADSMWAAPREWCPNPNSTICIRMAGNSMSPSILDGYLVAVDTSQIDRTRLVGKLVVAHHFEIGLLVSRLKRFGRVDVLEADQREYEPVSLALESGWRIVGRVLWWVGRAS